MIRESERRGACFGRRSPSSHAGESIVCAGRCFIEQQHDARAATSHERLEAGDVVCRQCFCCADDHRIEARERGEIVESRRRSTGIGRDAA